MMTDILSPWALATFGAAGAGLWSILCRLSVMTPERTQSRIVLQHILLAAGLVSSAVWSIDWSALRSLGASGLIIDFLATPEIGLCLLTAAVVGWLLIGSNRWRHGPPAGTEKD